MHVARAVTFRGIINGDYLSFSNDEEGFHNLLLWIQKLQTTHSLSAAIVGMEPTGHYDPRRLRGSTCASR
jgi:transposase